MSRSARWLGIVATPIAVERLIAWSLLHPVAAIFTGVFFGGGLLAHIIHETDGLEESLKGELLREQMQRIGDVAGAEEERDEARAEIERLKATPPEKREDLRCVIADLAETVRERNVEIERLRRERDTARLQVIEEAARRGTAVTERDAALAALAECAKYHIDPREDKR